MKNLFSIALLIPLLYLSGCAYTLPTVPYAAPIDHVTTPLSTVINFSNYVDDIVVYDISYRDDRRNEISILRNDFVFPSGHKFFARVPFGWLVVKYGYLDSRGDPRYTTKSVLITHRVYKVVFGVRKVGGSRYRQRYEPDMWAR